MTHRGRVNMISTEGGESRNASGGFKPSDPRADREEAAGGMATLAWPWPYAIERSCSRKREHGTQSHRVLTPQTSAFTLVEMLVVVTIVLIALTIVLPAATALWNQRKISDAENTIQGLLMTARAGALRAGGVDAGLLFFVDERGTQQVVSIEQDVTGRLDCGQNSACQAAWENVFRVTEQRKQRMPAPMRAVPRYVVDDEGDPNVESEEAFSPQELSSNFFEAPIGGYNQAQRHRNFFTMVYSSSGNLLVGRDVLIRDDDLDGDALGDLTGMEVGMGQPSPDIKDYFAQDDTVTPIGPAGSNQAIPFLVAYREAGSRIAINFPSVDGLLVYDDALFNEHETAEEKRAYLLSEGMPFYVNRITGAVIRGPTGETTP